MSEIKCVVQEGKTYSEKYQVAESVFCLTTVFVICLCWLAACGYLFRSDKPVLGGSLFIAPFVIGILWSASVIWG